MQLTRIPIHIGLPKPLHALVIADTHLLFADGRDTKRCFDNCMKRIGEFEFINVGRNLPYFLEALLECQKNNYLLLHCGDLLDFCSAANIEVATRLLELSGVDYFYCSGNHEFSYCPGMKELLTPEEEAHIHETVEHAFKNEITYGSRVIGGINFVAVYNGHQRFEERALPFFEEQVAKGLPIVLLMHDPVCAPHLLDFLRNAEGNSTSYLIGADDMPLDPPTAAMLERLQNEPLLKAILAGHVHPHANVVDQFGSATEVLVGGAYYGYGAILDFD